MPTKNKFTKGLFVGLSTVDIIFDVRSFPQEDSKNTALRYTAAAGGPASNAAATFSFLGGKAKLISCVGASTIGTLATADLRELEVQHIDLQRASDNPAISSILVVAKNASRTIVTTPAIDSNPDVRLTDGEIRDMVADVSVVLLDGHLGGVAKRVAAAAKHEKIPVVFDGDLYQRETDEYAEFIDVAIFGKSFRLDESGATQGAFDYFAARGVPMIAATSGGDSVEYAHRDKVGSISVPSVDVVDTLGAGDIFHGAFCYFFAKQNSFEDSLRLATRVAAHSVSRFGTRDWMASFHHHDDS